MTLMHERKNNLVVRVDDEEIAMLRAIADARDEPMTMVVRKLVRDAYVERFGIGVKPVKTKTTK